jgi:hypothetical protein
VLLKRISLCEVDQITPRNVIFAIVVGLLTASRSDAVGVVVPKGSVARMRGRSLVEMRFIMMCCAQLRNETACANGKFQIEMTSQI